MVEIWLTENYYREYRKRRGVLFNKNERFKLFDITKTLQMNWPKCATSNQIPPEVGTKGELYYIKCDFNSPKAIFRVCFCLDNRYKDMRLVALSCRTKEELAQGSKDGTRAWYLHMRTVGEDRRDSYLRDQLSCWKIY